MLKRLPRYVLAAAALGAGAMAAAGCADNESMLFVRQVLFLEGPECEAKADSNSLFLTRGVLDVAFSLRYDAVLLVGNQLVDRGSKDLVRTETSRVTIRGSEVRLLDTKERAIVDPFTVSGSGFVDPASGDVPGFGLVGTTLIPQSVAEKFDASFGGDPSAQATVIANVKVFGDTLGGEELESSELTFPITVCFGCLVSYPPEADDPVRSGYQCTLGDTSGGATTKVENKQCLAGQDAPIDCRLCCASFGGIASYDQICRCTTS